MTPTKKKTKKRGKKVARKKDPLRGAVESLHRSVSALSAVRLTDRSELIDRSRKLEKALTVVADKVDEIYAKVNSRLSDMTTRLQSFDRKVARLDGPEERSASLEARAQEWRKRFCDAVASSFTAGARHITKAGRGTDREDEVAAQAITGAFAAIRSGLEVLETELEEDEQ